MTMAMKLEYEYDYVDSDKILQIIKEFENKLKELDNEIVCRNFQIQSNVEYSHFFLKTEC